MSDLANKGERYGLDFDEPLDWATLVDLAAEAGCVEEILELQALLSIGEADELFRRLASGAAPPADYAALLRAALEAARG